MAGSICEHIEILQFQQRPNDDAQPEYQRACRIKRSENPEGHGIKCIAELDCKICVDALEKWIFSEGPTGNSREGY